MGLNFSSPQRHEAAVATAAKPAALRSPDAVSKKVTFQNDLPENNIKKRKPGRPKKELQKVEEAAPEKKRRKRTAKEPLGAFRM